jgi:hypothetical protein
MRWVQIVKFHFSKTGVGSLFRKDSIQRLEHKNLTKTNPT